MTSWVRIDHALGMPAVRLLVNWRSDWGRHLLQGIKDAKDDVDELAEQCQLVVETVRPELKGCTVVGVMAHRLPMMLSIDVIHPSLKRTRCSEPSEEQMLELCPVCHGLVSADVGKWLRRMWQGRDVLVCSQECCVKEECPVDLSDLPVVHNCYVCEKCAWRGTLDPSECRVCKACGTDHIRKQRVGE